MGLISTDKIGITWKIPTDIVSTTNYDRIRIYRSTSQNQNYVLIDASGNVDPTSSGIASRVDATGEWVTSFTDNTRSMGQRDSTYYLMKFYDQTNNRESKFYLTFYAMTPHEARIILSTRNFLSPFIANCLDDEDLRGGLILALQYFNAYPPSTSFGIDDLPAYCEPFLHIGTAIFSLLYRYLGIAMTDFGYSDMGLSLTLDRGSKIQIAVDKVMKLYDQLVPVVKYNFIESYSGIQTLQLPISIGSNLNRGLLNCAVENNKNFITKADGSKILLRKVKVGDKLLGYDGKTFTETIVTKVFKRNVSDYVKVIGPDFELYVTPEHPIYVKGNYIDADKLVKGDKVLLDTGKESTVGNVLAVKETVPVINFHCEPHNNFCINGVLSHNCLDIFTSMGRILIFGFGLSYILKVMTTILL
jgi:hypothetical protein